MTTEFASIISAVYGIYHEAALRSGYSDGEQLVLYALIGDGKKHSKMELYKTTGLSRMSACAAINRLKKKGFLSFERSIDGVLYLSLTDTGREAAENTVGKIIRAEQEIVSGWEQEERDLYLKLSKDYLVKFQNKVRESFQ